MIARTSPSLTRDLAGALKWCRRQLSLPSTEGTRRVWCVRRREGGLVVTFIVGTAEEVGTWLAFDGEPLDNFTLTPMRLDGENVLFGEERDWRGGLHH